MNTAVRSNYIDNSGIIEGYSPCREINTVYLRGNGPSVIRCCRLAPRVTRTGGRGNSLRCNFNIVLGCLFHISGLVTVTRGDLPLRMMRGGIPCVSRGNARRGPRAPGTCGFRALVLSVMCVVSGDLPFRMSERGRFTPMGGTANASSIRATETLLRGGKVRVWCVVCNGYSLTKVC